MRTPTKIITFDGPASSGKSSVASRVAKKLGYGWVSTGKLYRLVALLCQEKGWMADPSSKDIESLVKSLHGNLSFDGQGGLVLKGASSDLLDSIHTEETGLLAAAVAQLRDLRESLLPLQRSLAWDSGEEGMVFDGRDMGTVVFADQAFMKFYLTASLEVRALRRWHHLNGDLSPKSHELERVTAKLKSRDEEDSTRLLAPLRPASDALVIDTSHLSLEEVVVCVYGLMAEKLAEEALIT